MVQVEEHKRTENLKQAKRRFEQAAMLMREAGVSLIAAGVERADLDDVEVGCRELSAYARQVSTLLDDPAQEGGPNCPCERPVCRCVSAPSGQDVSSVIDLGILRASFERYAQNLDELAASIEPPSGLRAGYSQCADDVRTLLAAGEGKGCVECERPVCVCQFDVETRATAEFALAAAERTERAFVAKMDPPADYVPRETRRDT